MKVIELIKTMKDLKGTVISLISRGGVFIYPTDTVYGIGCNAEMAAPVQRIRALKRTQHPFSVIAPSMDWIKENMVINHPEYLDKLPGPYTLILQKKRHILRDVSRLDTLGIRIPAHPFTKVIQEAGFPFVTTSANVSGQDVLRGPDDIPEELKNRIDVIIDAGVLDNPPSTVFDLTGEEVKTIRG